MKFTVEPKRKKRGGSSRAAHCYAYSLKFKTADLPFLMLYKFPRVPLEIKRRMDACFGWEVELVKLKITPMRSRHNVRMSDGWEART
jgi:hypothetical protein